MILKEIDNFKFENLKVLETLYKSSKSVAQKGLIKKELNLLQSGLVAEKQNIYYINTILGDSKNYVLIHDLRLEYKGKTAQIDHLLLNKIGIIILESKSLKGEVTIREDGGLDCKYNNKTSAYPNPLEQAKRQASLLEDLLKDNGYLSNNLRQKLEIEARVIFSPDTVITNQELPKNYHRGDSFYSEYVIELEKWTSSLKVLKKLTTYQSHKSLQEMGNFLLSQHKPVEFDYTKKFKIKTQEIEQKPIKQQENSINDQLCPRCKEGYLVLRTSKKQTKYASNQFLGCSRYPKCRYNEGIE